MKSLIKDESAYSFIWLVAIIVMFITNFVWTLLYEPFKDFHLMHEEAFPDDVVGGFLFFVFEMFPVWCLIGVSLYAIVNSQKSDGEL